MNSGTRFNEQILFELRQIVDELSLGSLRIAVLGPDLKDLRAKGTVKRYQIADALEDDGHEAFFPEQYIDRSVDAAIWVEQERKMLRDANVDLIIILVAEGSIGVASEIGNFVVEPDICSKTAVLFPERHYRPKEGIGLTANSLKVYWTKMFYTEEQLDICELVPVSRRWADDRLKGTWRFLPSEKF